MKLTFEAKFSNELPVAFLLASITFNIAAENVIVAEFLTAQLESSYPINDEIIASPMNSLYV